MITGYQAQILGLGVKLPPNPALNTQDHLNLWAILFPLNAIVCNVIFKKLGPKSVWLSGQSVGLRTVRSQVRFQSRACALVVGTSPVGGVQEAAD